MHSPESLLFSINIIIPWKREHDFKDHDPDATRMARVTFLSVWHVDPCKDGSDDSCGLFMTARHSPIAEAVMREVMSSLDYEWQTTHESSRSDEEDEEEDEEYGPPLTGMEMTPAVRHYEIGSFDKRGNLLVSPHSLVLDVAWKCAFHHYKESGDRHGKAYTKAWKYVRANAAHLIMFSDGPGDTLMHHLRGTFRGPKEMPDLTKPSSREEHMRGIVAPVYGMFLRKTRPWWKHPRFHFHHWSINFDLFRRWRRALFVKCSICKKRLGTGCPVLEGNHLICRRCSSGCLARAAAMMEETHKETGSTKTPPMERP